MPLPTLDSLAAALSQLNDTYTTNANRFVDLESLADTTLDPMSALAHLAFSDMSGAEEWIAAERNRRIDKGFSNAIGKFHESVLQSVPGWQKPETGFDLRHEDRRIVVEVKNKHNTMNSETTRSVFDKCERFVQSNPNWTVYLGQIIPKKGRVKEKWKTSGRTGHDRVMRVDGATLYEIVMEEDDALLKIFKMLPDALGILGKELNSDSYALILKMYKMAYSS